MIEHKGRFCDWRRTQENRPLVLEHSYVSDDIMSRFAQNKTHLSNNDKVHLQQVYQQ